MRPAHWTAGDLSKLDNMTDDGRQGLVEYLSEIYVHMPMDDEDPRILNLDFLLEALGTEGHDGN